MIFDGILLIFQGVFNVLLLPLTALNIGIDFISSIPIVTQFLQLVAYILPWGNILPVIILTFSIFLFRIAIAFVKTVWDLLPLL